MAKVTQAHIDARRAEILEAATELFADKGIEHTTMQEIATRAGISAGSIYHYFSDKDALLETALQEQQRQTMERFAAAESTHSSPLEALLDVGSQALTELCSRQQVILHLETMLAGARNPDAFTAAHRAVHEDVVALIRRLVYAAQDAGEIAADLDPQMLALLCNATVAGIEVSFLEIDAKVDPRAPLQLLAEILKRSAPSTGAQTSTP
jgi:TetR/AcrR family transcriptional regulator, repressor for uid operon